MHSCSLFTMTNPVEVHLQIPCSAATPTSSYSFPGKDRCRASGPRAPAIVDGAVTQGGGAQHLLKNSRFRPSLIQTFAPFASSRQSDDS